MTTIAVLNKTNLIGNVIIDPALLQTALELEATRKANQAVCIVTTDDNVHYVEIASCVRATMPIKGVPTVCKFLRLRSGMICTLHTVNGSDCVNVVIN